MSDHACPACGYVHPNMDDREWPDAEWRRLADSIIEGIAYE